jgi:hypothetical protein
MEEEAENPQKEIKSQKKKSARHASRKPPPKDFLRDNISSSSMRSRRSSILPPNTDRSNSIQKDLLLTRTSSSDKLLQPPSRLTMRRASMQPIAIHRLQNPRNQSDHSTSMEKLLENQSLKRTSIGDSKHLLKIDKSVDEEGEEEGDHVKDEVDKSKEKSKKVSGHALLINLMKQNVGEVKLSTEQKALHEAYHTLIHEYKRRKALRNKTGLVFKRARSKIKDMLKVKNAWTGGAEGKDFLTQLKVNKESDLELKSRSQFLQKRKVAIKKKSGHHHDVVNYTEADRI